MNTASEFLPMLVRLRLDDWTTVLEALRRHLIDKGDVVRYATQLLASCNDAPAELVEMAGADYESTEYVEHLGESLASGEATSLADAVDRVRLARLLVLRRCTKDEDQLLRVVADTYSDFGYPADMTAAVYYMPVHGSAHANIGDKLQSPIAALDAVIANLIKRLGGNVQSDDAG